jgi:hypothetical protein
MHSDTKRVHWLLWPVYALWKFVATIIELTGRFIAILLGVVLMVAGGLLCLTIVGAIVGIPLILFGAMLTIRGIF